MTAISRTERASIVDYGTVGSEEQFCESLRRAGDRCGYLVADFGDYEMPGWTALAAVHRAAARLRERGGRLAVVVQSERLRRLLRLTLLDQGFNVFVDRGDALRAHGPTPDAVELELPSSRPFEDVRHLVTAGVGSRAGLGVDRIDDLQLALDTVLHRPGRRGPTTVALSSTEDELRVEVGTLAAAGSDPGLERILSALVSEVETRRTGGDVWITLHASTRRVAAESR